MRPRPVVVEPRKKTLAVVVFVALMVATVGLAFILENLRPRVRAVAPAAPAFRADVDDDGEQRERTKHTA